MEYKELYKRKRALEQIRMFKKPIDKEEIEEHAKKYELILEKLMEDRQKERDKKKEQDHDEEYDPGKYKTKTYQEVAMMDLQIKEEKETREEMKKLLIEKKDSYARYVREMHLPQRSQKKIKELAKVIEHIHHPVRHKVKYPPGLEMKRAKSHSRTKERSSSSREKS